MRPALFALALLAPSALGAQSALDASARSQVIDTLLAKLDARYVFPDKAKAMASDIRARAARGDYESVTSPRAFADSLSRHLQSVSHDKHLRVFAGAPFAGKSGGPPSQDECASARAPCTTSSSRHGASPATLPCWRSSGSASRRMIEDAVATAMDSVADASALIIDVRRNGGGSPGSVALVSSYLFGRDTVHLNSLYWRAANRTDEFWTRADVKGKRFGPTKPVFVLTSRRTFSAAEEFTYNLQSLRRATIVGDTTGGGAHPGGGQPLPYGLSVFLPEGRAINPITKTNWEGTGVRPDIATSSDSALVVAHRAALDALLKVASDPARRAALERAKRETVH